jgi:hypothetical protein
MATLNDGQWFEYPLDSGIPKRVVIREGERKHSKTVTTITKMQALSLARWHGHQGIYWSVKDGNGRWIDVRVVGDVNVWCGDGDGE